LDPTLDSGRLDPTQTTRAALVTDEIRFSWIAMRFTVVHRCCAAIALLADAGDDRRAA